ncbi:MAG: hypothetical protein ACXAC8_00050 [Candidatus Hodarchaeales archaeon]|jgi:hypothetical protein
MASQYITFMIVFTLGMTMVIMTNSMFLNLSDQVRQNIADTELTQILDELQLKILQIIYLQSGSNQTVKQVLELPQILGQGFQYEIEITNSSDNQISLNGIIAARSIIQVVTFSIGEKYSLITFGSFKSASSLMILHIEKNYNEITILIK